MRIVVIGGGAAGMTAAYAAAKNKKNEVIILEKNEKLGKKLYISGKGRCNLTNDCDREEFFKNIVRNSKFLYSSFDLFSNKDLKELIETNGCPLKTERGNRVFPMSDKSSDIIKTLEKILNGSHVKIYFNAKVSKVKKIDEDETFDISYHSGKAKDNKNGFTHIIADKVIIATGGLSYPVTGSTGDGYRFARDFDLQVSEQSPSLVPFNVREIDECKSMQGLTLKNVGIKIYEKDNPKEILYKDSGELLFTHFGVSGPVILSASCYVDQKCILSIDLKPALSESKLDERLLREIEVSKNKKLKSIIETLLPKSMVEIFLKRLDKSRMGELPSRMGELYEPLSDIKVHDIDKGLRKSIVNLLKDFRLTLVSKRGFDEAIVTRGGVDVKEINPKTMESKKVKGLYFAGEVLDIDALTGGFNIQIAATTGYAAGNL